MKNEQNNTNAGFGRKEITMNQKNNMRNTVTYTVQAERGSIECQKVVYRDRKLTCEGARRWLVRETGNDTISVSRVEAMKQE